MAHKSGTTTKKKQRKRAPQQARSNDGEKLLVLVANSEVAAHQRAGATDSRKKLSPDGYKTVCVLGGGTAGYLAALALRKNLPHLEVTLIESKRIPIIGVGEATTPTLLAFLHYFLDIDIVDFYEKVKPTWKLGIKFDWGAPGDYWFNAPFDWDTNGIGLLGSLRYEDRINSYTALSIMMDGDVTPILRPSAKSKSYTSLLSLLPFAYHLDNARFVSFLHEVAVSRGVRYVDSSVLEVVMSPDNAEVESLILANGEKVTGDLFIDCSGFRSELLEKRLGSKYVSYASSLYTDKAVTFNLPHGGKLKPYTTAKTMDSGWCWIIPTPENDHLGYVFSSAFCSEDQAVEEAQRTFPGMKPRSVVNFRSGRHEEMWKGNVFAVGNSYAFVEPLESTGIFMICREIAKLIHNFPERKTDTAVKAYLNRSIADEWDSLRWFLAIHYKFNNKYSTKFWKEARANVDVTGNLDAIRLYQEGAPLTYRSQRTRDLVLNAVGDTFFGLTAFDSILGGQKVPCRLIEPVEPKRVWLQRKKFANEICKMAVPQAEALDAVRANPSFLMDLLDVNGDGSWMRQPAWSV